MLDDLASERSIAEIMAYRAALPLDRRYRIAFFTLEALDSIIVCLRDQDGREGWGEVTILTGYTDETVASGWSFACRQSEALAGLSTRAGEATALAAHCKLSARRQPLSHGSGDARIQRIAHQRW